MKNQSGTNIIFKRPNSIQMKKTLSLAILWLFSLTLFAQNKPIVQQTDSRHRTETYLYSLGEDSVRYTIEGVDDTLLTEKFRPNGFVYAKSFRNDSTFFYDQLERLAIRKYFFDKKQQDSTVYYYSDGTLSLTQTKRDSLMLIKQFDQKGNTLSTITFKSYPSVKYTVQENEQGKVRSSTFKTERIGADSFRFNYDTTYYDGNRIKLLNIIVSNIPMPMFMMYGTTIKSVINKSITTLTAHYYLHKYLTVCDFFFSKTILIATMVSKTEKMK